ncbi:MAG: hypothetical protein PHE88_11940 [Elusimicrobia bacterium]|nr:hypothetical protein [Elusimicrobiota bacterium]
MKNIGYKTIKALNKMSIIAFMRAVLPLMVVFFCFSCVLENYSFAATGYRSNFLSYGPGVAAMAMGDTFTAYGNDMSVIYYNPALLGKLDGEEVSANHWFLFDTARYDFVGFSSAGDNSAFALAGTQFYRGNIEVRTKIDDVETKTENNQMAIYGAYAGYINSIKLNYGGSLKWLNYNMNTENGTGFGLDIGLAKQLLMTGNPVGRKIVINSGVLFQNPLQVSMKMIDTKEDLPVAVKLGLSGSMTVFPKYSKIKDKLSYDDILIATDLTYSDKNLLYSFGVQYMLYEFAMFRLGWKQGLTAGLGFLLSDFQLDYAFVSKDFTNFHKIGFSYRFGKKEDIETKIAPTFTEEFQKVYQQSCRIYDRFFREATTYAELEKYEEAIILLKKAIPLKPEDNSPAKQLLNTCEQTIIANKMNVYITEARKNISKNNFVEAYKSYLKAFDINPEDKNIKTFLDDIYDRVSQPVKKADPNKIMIDKVIYEYSQGIENNINSMLEKNDFNRAEKEFTKLHLLIPELEQTKTVKRKIKDRKDLYVYSFVTKGIKCLGEDKPDEAYFNFSEAAKLSPDDTGIKDQKEIAKKKYLAKKKYSIEDNVYSDKLYCLAAINFATDETSLSTYEELKNFNTVYESLPVLENALLDANLIQRQKP